MRRNDDSYSLILTRRRRHGRVDKVTGIIDIFEAKVGIDSAARVFWAARVVLSTINAQEDHLRPAIPTSRLKYSRDCQKVKCKVRGRLAASREHACARCRGLLSQHNQRLPPRPSHFITQTTPHASSQCRSQQTLHCLFLNPCSASVHALHPTTITTTTSTCPPSMLSVLKTLSRRRLRTTLPQAALPRRSHTAICASTRCSRRAPAPRHRRHAARRAVDEDG
jgi:hypothetical protein